ncbi:hypothetical protein ACLK15_05295 [Escherichia coli]
MKAVLKASMPEREVLSERFATLSFDVQKTQRLHQAFSRFIGSHLAVAFESDPEAEIRQLNSSRVELEQALSDRQMITSSSVLGFKSWQKRALRR